MDSAAATLKLFSELTSMVTVRVCPEVRPAASMAAEKSS